METSVALGLVDGQTVQRIASYRDVSIRTVRNQLKAAMSMSHVNRQAERATLTERLRRE